MKIFLMLNMDLQTRWSCFQAGYATEFLRSLHLAAGSLVHLRWGPRASLRHSLQVEGLEIEDWNSLGMEVSHGLTVTHSV